MTTESIDLSPDEEPAPATIADMPPGSYFFLLDDQESFGRLQRIESVNGGRLSEATANAIDQAYHVHRFPRDTPVLPLSCMRDDVRRYYVTIDMEWGIFFVHAFARQNRVDGSQIYAATFSCVSSFGAFGRHWSDLGEPFERFVQSVRDDYLLGKISTKVTQTEKICESIKQLLDQRVNDGDMRPEDANEAKNLLHNYAQDYSDELLAHRLYRSKPFNRLFSPYDWTELAMRDYPLDAKNFVTVLWPEFVRQLKAEIRPDKE